MKQLSWWFASLWAVLGLTLGDSLWSSGSIAKVSDPTATAVGDKPKFRLRWWKRR